MGIGIGALEWDEDRAAPVLCAGQVVLDLYVPPLLAMPDPGELVTTSSMITGVGGCSANTAVVLERLGASASLSAMVGTDTQATLVRQALGARSVGADGLTVSAEYSTSQTVVLAVNGEDRRYIHSVGANAGYSDADLAAALPGFRALILGGYLSLPGLTADGVASVLREARRNGVLTVLDVVVPQGATGSETALRTVLPYVDCFTPNRDEAATLTGEYEPLRQAEAFLRMGCGSVAITCGDSGAVYADGTRAIQVEAPPTVYVDGSGAGDAFTAALVLGLQQGWAIENVMRFASVVGASVTRGIGTTQTLCSWDEASAIASDVRILDLTL